jgi:hypothetical protein
MSGFSGRDRVRKRRLWGRYEVGDDGVVYSGGMPLKAIGGVGVNLGGKRVKVAYLVARAFVPNGECREHVRHRNGDVTDNRACNLEWCDEREDRRRVRRGRPRVVRAWKVSGELAGMWGSVREASAVTGVRESGIRDALAGRQRSAGGLLWESLG